jgi:hypothetical protein
MPDAQGLRPADKRGLKQVREVLKVGTILAETLTPDEKIELANLSSLTRPIGSEDDDTYRHQPLTLSQDVRRLREREGGTVR